MIIVYSIIVLFLIGTIFWIISTLISLYGGSIFLGTNKEVFRAAFELGQLKKGERMYELGSGLGEGLIIASKEFKAQSFGWEISPFYYFCSKLRTVGNRNIKIFLGDFRKVDLSQAQLIYCYLTSSAMKALAVKFSQELLPGSRVVTNTFRLPGLEPAETRRISSRNFYLYKF